MSDNGVGMSREEVIANIGTIAKSGTREFLAALTGDQAKDARLIGQFGVGFYSSFIVADRVTLLTRRAGRPATEGVRWESDGTGEYTIETVEKASRGTDVTLHLREGLDDFLSDAKLKSILRKYSDHIAIPIVMQKLEWSEEKKEMVGTGLEETVNQASALWARPKSEITDEQYQEFYRHVAHDFEPPLAWTHNRVEGRQEYTQLLYIPSRAPFDLWDRHHRHGLKLYVRRVFIMDDAEHLLPAYLRFVRGVVDSNDLPLNVSREILQESRDVEAIRSGCTRRVLQLLEELAENQQEKYATFWKGFGQVLKEGAGEDAANRDRIAKLLRFASTHADTDEQSVSLADYVGRMKEGQDRIYYVTADTFLGAKSSPHLEVFRKKGIEVLLLSDRVDEWVVAHLPRVRREAARFGDARRAGARQAGDRRRARSRAEARRRLPRAGRADQAGAGRAREGGAHDGAPDVLSGVPRGGRARPGRESPADPARRRAGGAEVSADPRDQPGAPDGRAADARGEAVQGMGRAALRPGAARRGRHARRPGGIREAAERAHARPGRRRRPGSGRRAEYESAGADLLLGPLRPAATARAPLPDEQVRAPAGARARKRPRWGGARRTARARRGHRPRALSRPTSAGSSAGP